MTGLFESFARICYDIGCVNCYTQTLMNASMPTLAWRIPSVITQKAAMNAFAKLDLKKARLANASVSIPLCSLRASSPVWAGEASLARTRERGTSASLAQIGELARRLPTVFSLMLYCHVVVFND